MGGRLCDAGRRVTDLGSRGGNLDCKNHRRSLVSHCDRSTGSAAGCEMQELFDSNADLRSEAEWRRLLSTLVDSLSQFTGVQFQATSWFTQDDKPGYASSCNTANIRGEINSSLPIDGCGVVSICINFKEAVWVSCRLLLFSVGQRIGGEELMSLSYTEEGWVTGHPRLGMG